MILVSVSISSFMLGQNTKNLALLLVCALYEFMSRVAHMGLYTNLTPIVVAAFLVFFY